MTLCSHLIYSFIGVDEFGNLNYLYKSEIEGKRFMTSMKNLKLRNPELKILAAIGGADIQQTIAFSTLTKFPMRRLNFIQNMIKISMEFLLDGIDIDYEFPQSNEDKHNFAQLLEEIKISFNSYGFILSIAVAPDRWRAEQFYDIPRISKAVDFINLMTYDFHGSWSEVIGHHAQMFSHIEDSDYMKELNCASSVIYWLSHGASADKLNLGIPTYGNVFYLNNLKLHKIGDNSINKTITITKGFPMNFNVFCDEKKKSWKQYYDFNYQVYYAVNENEMKWFGFDHHYQIELKAKFILERNLSGAVIWSVDGDDFKNKCDFNNSSLISTMFTTLNKSN